MTTPIARWERAVEAPLMVSALVFLVAFAVPIAWWPDTPPDVVAACEWAVWVSWSAFAVDYAVRLTLTQERWSYVRRHWFDLVVLLLPVLRPLRLLRLVSVLTLINRNAAANLRGRVGLCVGGGSALVALVGALAVVDAERGAEGANITTLGDAFWWAATTMTTVGYGDHYPITAVGRASAVGLMVCGIAILGTVTATLASWIVERVSDASHERDALVDEVRELPVEVAALRQTLTPSVPEPPAESLVSPS